MKLRQKRIDALRKPGRYGDGGTLFLVVTPAGTKHWVQRLVIHGTRRDIGLGGYPLVSLTEARDLAFDNRRIARRGGDPLAGKRRETAPTFATCAQRCLDAHRGDWSDGTRRQWMPPLQRYAFPTIGDLPVDTLSRQHVIKIVEPLIESVPSQARKVYKTIRAVLTWAQGAGHLESNVAADGSITAALPALRRQNTTNHKAIPFAALPDAYSRIVTLTDTEATTKAALLFLILTGVRSAEARDAEWSEIDDSARTWTIPAARMGKTKRPHTVPLSPEAFALVESMRGRSARYIFPSTRTGRPLSKMGFDRIMSTAGIDGTVHGFRSCLKTWATDKTEYPPDVVESALAHAVGNAVERAYTRTDRLEKRRALMADWARFVTGAE